MSTNIKYKYAFDEKHNLVNIEEVIKENRKQNKFYCISCGKELIPRLGDIRVRHFAHKNSEEASVCNKETYLHSLGKQLIKNKFDTEKTFNISFQKYCKCHHASECASYSPEICKAEYWQTVNLKEFYDKCELEKKTGDFVADVLLSSAKENVPEILIEIKCTHACTDSKINSGYRIIEINVESEDDLGRIVNGTILESPTVQFNNFKRDGRDNLYKRAQEKVRSYFYQSEKFDISVQHTVYCNQQNKCTFYNEDECSKFDYFSTINFKEKYKQCDNNIEENQSYALKLYNNDQSNISPLFFDFCCTSKCTQPKSTDRKNFIKICFKSLEYLDSVIENKFQSDDITIWHENIEIPKNYNYSSDIKRYDISVFTLYKSGKYSIDKHSDGHNNVSCKSIQQSNKKTAIFQIAFEDINDETEAYRIGYSLANILGIKHKSCLLCSYHEQFPSQRNYCSKSKDCKRNMFPEISEANKCEDYNLNDTLLYEYKNKLKFFKYKRLST